MEWVILQHGRAPPPELMPEEDERVVVAIGDSWEEAEFVDGRFCQIDGPEFEEVAAFLRIKPPV